MLGWETSGDDRFVWVSLSRAGPVLVVATAAELDRLYAAVMTCQIPRASS
jgi:hypothetical protein